MNIKSILKDKKITPFSVAFIFILIYISFINIFALKTTPEVIVIEFAILVLIFKKARAKDFAKFWIPLMALFFLYEFLRGYADNLSPFYNYTLFWVYELEKFIFPTLPTIFLQDLFGKNNLIINISLFFYSTFFYYSFIIAYLIWLYKKEVFKIYAIGFLILVFTGLAFFILMPTAPPWMVSELTNSEVSRLIFTNNYIYKLFAGFSFWNYFIYNNTTAAFPSLHVALPAFSSLFLIIYLKKKIFYLTLTVPLMIGFSVVLTGEHFLVDIIWGFILALISLLLAKKLANKI